MKIWTILLGFSMMVFQSDAINYKIQIQKDFVCNTVKVTLLKAINRYFQVGKFAGFNLDFSISSSLQDLKLISFVDLTQEINLLDGLKCPEMNDFLPLFQRTSWGLV